MGGVDSDELFGRRRYSKITSAATKDAVMAAKQRRRCVRRTRRWCIRAARLAEANSRRESPLVPTRDDVFREDPRTRLVSVAIPISPETPAPASEWEGIVLWLESGTRV